MINKTILSFCLLFSLLICFTSCSILTLKISKDDVTLCPINGGLYSVDTENSYFIIDKTKFPTDASFLQYFLENTTDGYLYLDQPKSKDAGVFLDDFINSTIYDGYARQTGANVTGAEYLGSYLCSYTFIEQFKKPCSILCEPLIKRVQPFNYTNIPIVPSLDDCLAAGTTENSCSAIGLTGYLGNFKPIKPTIKEHDKYPGGVVRGSLLGFGVLIGLLLIIASMGFIMKQQTK